MKFLIGNGLKLKQRVQEGYCYCGCGKRTTICDRNDNRRGYIKGQPHKWITGHHQVINELDTSMFKRLSNGCWEWLGCIGSNGYGIVTYKRERMSAHRAFYLAIIGEVEEGLVVDHKCHNISKNCKGGDACKHRRCVNPMHLEAVTRAENVRRGFKSVLTKDKVEVARIMYRVFSYKQIAKTFGVGVSTIQKAVEQRTWKL